MVPAVIEELENHETAHTRFAAEVRRDHAVYCSSHTLAESYATLIALPLKRRISGPEAAHLIQVNFVKKLEVIDLSFADYAAAIERCSSKGRVSGQIYDALHLVAALKAGCDLLLTYNLAHFRSLLSDEIAVAIP